MTPTIVIPWRDTADPHRAHNLDVVLAHLTRLGWPILLADSNPGAPFNRSAARNQGVRDATTRTVLLHDADLLIPHDQLRRAADTATRTGALVHPYTTVDYLNEHGRRAHTARDAPGGAAAITATAYARTGGYDETFTGWGFEDNDFANRAATTIGRRHITGRATHLWHPPSPRDEHTAANRHRMLERARPDAWVIVPTHTKPPTLDALIDRAGLPVIVIHTRRGLTPHPGAHTITDTGPVDIHRWWQTGITEAQTRGATRAVLVNHDAVPADATQLPALVDALNQTGATIAYPAPRATPVVRDYDAHRRITGWCFALNLEHGLRPPAGRYAWYFGDDWLDREARTHHHGVVGAPVKVTHRKPKGAAEYPPAFAPLVAADRARWAVDRLTPDTTSDDHGMPVVYVVRPGETNDELRYSLRSLTHLPHGTVWVIGHKPRWVTNVQHLPTKQGPITGAGKYSNVWAGLRALADHGPEEFLLFNDDFHVLRPVDDVPPMHLGPLAALTNPAPATAHARRLAVTAAHLPPGALSYEAHVPIPMRRAHLATILDELEHHPEPRPLTRSVYGNTHHTHPVRLDNDVKITRHTTPDTWAGWTWLSTSDLAWRAAAPDLHRRFPHPSPHER